MKVRAERSFSAGPLQTNKDGNTSPVLTFTPGKGNLQHIYDSYNPELPL